LKPEHDCPPYLVFDPLGGGTPLRRNRLPEFGGLVLLERVVRARLLFDVLENRVGNGGGASLRREQAVDQVERRVEHRPVAPAQANNPPCKLLQAVSAERLHFHLFSATITLYL
jgi:hypothetical protein